MKWKKKKKKYNNEILEVKIGKGSLKRKPKMFENCKDVKKKMKKREKTKQEKIYCQTVYCNKEFCNGKYIITREHLCQELPVGQSDEREDHELSRGGKNNNKNKLYKQVICEFATNQCSFYSILFS